MSDGSIFYCWSCDAHRRAATNAGQAACCPQCGATFTEDCRIGKGSGENRRPIFALDIGRPCASSAPTWSGNVAAAS